MRSDYRDWDYQDLIEDDDHNCCPCCCNCFEEESEPYQPYLPGFEPVEDQVFKSAYLPWIRQNFFDHSAQLLRDLMEKTDREIRGSSWTFPIHVRRNSNPDD